MAAMFEGKVALVTGGASGIGRATALAFAREGAKVVVADVDARGGENTAQEVRKCGSEALFVGTDVSKEEDVEGLIRAAVDTYGRLDSALNNAGIEGLRAPLAGWPEQEWERLVSINLKGVWLCMKHEIRQMLRQGGGAIVNTASVAAMVGTPNASVYAAASHGILGLVKSAALEYAGAGIRINAVCPGVIRTPMIERVMAQFPDIEKPKMEAQMASRNPMRRMGTPQEVAQAVLWLCSDGASFVTGSSLLVDGGSAAR